MDLTNPADLIKLSRIYGLKPSKHYGQNFLISRKPVDKMMRAARVEKNDIVLEVGPGFGLLTLALAQATKRVIGFEIERRLLPYWQKKLKELENVDIVWGNALANFQAVAEMIPRYKVISNLPYQITGRMLKIILESENRPHVIVVMVQKEVAERICAGAGRMTLLSASVRYFGNPEIISVIGRGKFWPRPKVDSAILRVQIKGHALPDPDLEKKFFQYIKAGFAGKRKQVYKNLANKFNFDKDKVKRALARVVGNDKARAQDITVYQWLEIIQKLES